MNITIDWDSFVTALKYKSAIRPPHSLQRWLNYHVDVRGVEFLCEIDNGEKTGGYPETASLRLDIIFADVLRIRMNPETIVDRPSDMLVSQDWPLPTFEVKDLADRLVITTDRVRVEIIREPWQISAYPRQETDGLPFFSQRVDDRAYGSGFEVNPVGFELSKTGNLTVHETAAVRPGESFYGLGEKYTTLDKWGQEHRFWAIDCGNVSSYRSYKSIPFLMSSAGYGLFIHSSYPMLFRMGSQSNISYSFHIMDQALDYFLIYGPSYKHILARYANLTGYAPVPPKWSFGFWISRAGYKSRIEVEKIVREMRDRGFPCDVLNLDPYWMGEGPWTTLKWDTTQFPNPQEMIAWLRRQGIRTCLWINPYFPEGSPIYTEAKEYVIKAPDGTPAPVLEDFTGKELAAVDFTNPAAKAWFQEKLQKLLEMGVAVFKTDFGEQAPIDAIYHDGRSGLEMHNLYPLIYNQAVFELTKRFFGRGLTWGRSAYAGSQRYPVQWGGDSYSSLDQLSSQLRGLLSYGMSGVPFCSHDIGGFDYSPRAFDAVTQEDFPKDTVTYLRWLQVGVFSSHTRAHGKQPREPWTYGKEAEKIAKKYLTLRYRLLPYIYSQAVNSTQSALPIVRPLVLEFQQDPNVQRLDLEYMFGDAFLVAPTVSEATRQLVYLPAGIWIDFWNKEVVLGNRWIEIATSLEKLPLWVRGGSIVPMGPEMDFVNQKPLDPLTIELYTPKISGERTIFDEDLPSIPVKYHRLRQTLEVEVGIAPGSVEIFLYGVQAGSAFVNGQPVVLTACVGGQKITLAGNQQNAIVYSLIG